ncbi:kynureninase [Metschnikowia bicuspidata]|uniref:Kynureninase n=1 Tax=Metschnikowia bicuspidata TaxID=27322 RepID=A0A4P9ZGH2_9ASCO|nr:kynureninase [Metschnikowia bicuspidata]
MNQDEEFPTHRDEFAVPTFGTLGLQPPNGSDFTSDSRAIYFCGNSLGLLPLRTKTAIADELSAWAGRGVESHFNHPNPKKTPWADIDLPILELLAPMVGAKINEVAAMNSLTANLNALLIAFYKPTGKRLKILFEKDAFPSDYYAFLNMVKLHGYDESSLVQLQVPSGKTYLHTEVVLDAIDCHKDELALVCLPGIQFYTGQLFDIETITAHAHKYCITVGWDLAHVAGNVPVQLHAWDVDFAAWCSYKYLNSGPGAIGGIFVHERFTWDNSTQKYAPRLAGWWGTDASERFQMLKKFNPIQSALSYRQSNPSVLDCVALQASLEVFRAAGGVSTLRKKSVALTNYMELLLVQSSYYVPQYGASTLYGFKILTPLDENARGAQLSLLFQPLYEQSDKNVMEAVFRHLHDRAIICDERYPGVIRFAPTPLYNTFREIEIVVERVNEALKSHRGTLGL